MKISKSINQFLEQLNHSNQPIQGSTGPINTNKGQLILKDPVKVELKTPVSKITGDQKGLLTTRSIRG